MSPLLTIIILVFSIGFLMAMGLERLSLLIGFFIVLITYPDDVQKRRGSWNSLNRTANWLKAAELFRGAKTIVVCKPCGFLS